MVARPAWSCRLASFQPDCAATSCLADLPIWAAVLCLTLLGPVSLLFSCLSAFCYSKGRFWGLHAVAALDEPFCV